MQYVPQRRDHDCGVAALAMVTDTPYDEVAEAFAHRLAQKGLNESNIDEWLWRKGWAQQKVYQRDQLGTPDENGRLPDREHWPIAPWAPRHLVMLLATRDYHFVAMDESGIVFDPWNAERKALSHPDYQSIYWIAGLWPVFDRASQQKEKAG